MRLTQAQIARVRGLENRKAEVSARRVVEDARQKNSPLHALFDWDLKRAAEKHWLHRAREIIGCVTVQVTRSERTVSAPCYVHLPGKATYRRVDMTASNIQQATESLVYTLEVAAGHLRRAYDLAAPLGLATEIDALLEQVAGVQRIVTSKKAA